jgi:acyl-coenzyme A thioesterase PaaI-like protein
MQFSKPFYPIESTFANQTKQKESAESLQDKYSPNAVCFGCGPSNPRGLHIKSRPDGDYLVADWDPRPYHTAFEGYTSGGIIGILFDCHGNMTAAYALMRARGLAAPPGTVTASLSIKYLKPTPIGVTVHLRAHATKVEKGRVEVEGTLEEEGALTASMQGVYVAVKEGHPAFNKWS